jgi:hypothetical protein
MRKTIWNTRRSLSDLTSEERDEYLLYKERKQKAVAENQSNELLRSAERKASRKNVIAQRHGARIDRKKKEALERHK